MVPPKLGLQPVRPASTKASASAAAAARAATPCVVSLWDKLDLPPPDDMNSLHQNRRVVLLGNIFSGKRTLSRQLLRVLELQCPPSEEHHSSRTHRDSFTPLYAPAGASDGNSSVVSMEDASERSISMTSHSNPLSGVVTCDHSPDRFSHGLGLSHDYIIQRVPGNAAAYHNNDSGSSRVEFIRRTIEFFCCDTAGALFSALPTLQSLEEAVVLLVVDVSEPEKIQAQLDSNYSVLHTHVSKLLATHLPNQDEVRRIQMIEAQQQHWTAQEKRLKSLRAVLAAKGFAKEPLVYPGVCLDEVNAESLRAPPEFVCPIKSILVCTKTDRLERLSKVLEASPRPEEFENLLNRLVPASLCADMQRVQLSLLHLVSQLVRQYAIVHCSALVALSSRLSTAAAENACGTELAHPFYQSLWGYIYERLLDYSIPKMNSTIPHSMDPSNTENLNYVIQQTEFENLCTANFFPTAFLPSGLDALGLLSPFVVSQGVKLPLSSNSYPCMGLDNNAERGLDVPGLIVPRESENLTTQPIHSPALLKEHQAYLQEALASSMLSQPPHVGSVSSRSSVAHLRLSTQQLQEEQEVDGDTLIWDAL